jgi:stearoyl-CoA desaturase (delta-9 desaturase)
MDVSRGRVMSTSDRAAASGAALQTDGPPLYKRVLSAIVAIVPLLAATYLVFHAVGRAIPWIPIALMVVFMVVIGHGVTVGFHRLFAHRSFEANRPLKIFLALLGTLSFQGSLIGWVADHRRHHRYSDLPGDPHSPAWTSTDTPTSGLRGLWHAHFGWCLTNRATPRQQYASDLLADADLVAIDRLFLPMCFVTLALPFALGYVLIGTWSGAVAALLWAGLLRIGLSHNFTWSINSLCHRFGRRPFATHDRSTNVAWLAPFTMGESWHNNHHAFPRSARHGIDRGQLDSSAAVIRVLEWFGWATAVHWPNPVAVESRRAA